MKMMKKVLALSLAVLMVFTILGGCTDPVATNPTKASGNLGNSGPATQPTPGESQPSHKEPLRGTINLSFPMGDEREVFEAVANAYMDINPGVSVIINDIDSNSYATWLTAQLSSNSTQADIVINNMVSQYFGAGKFVDYANYLTQENPYADNQMWMDTLEEAAYRPTGSDQSIMNLNVDSTQLQWFYNKEIFEELNIEVPTTWEELVEVCDIIQKAGYVPIATSGNAESFWLLDMGWLIRIYTDQYFRDYEELVHAQKGDYCFDPDVDLDWTYNPNDILNDLPSNYTTNDLRVLKLLQEGTIGPNTDKFKDMLSNFAEVFPKYCQEGFFGMDRYSAHSLFFTGKAAMTFGLGDFYYEYFNAFDGVAEENKLDLGTFWSPAMTGEYVAVETTRSLGGPQGFLGVINKSQEQNDLVMDFMMFYSAPSTQTMRLQVMVETGWIPKGPVNVKGVELPEEYAFMDVGYVGECDLNPMTMIARGLGDEPTSVRAYQTNIQQFMQGKMSLDEYASTMQKTLQDAIIKYLKMYQYSADALDDVTKDPLS